MQRILLLLPGIAVASTTLFAQTTLPSFEVASVKRSPSGLGRSMIENLQPSGLWHLTNVPTRALVRTAYRVLDFQIVGAPDLVQTEQYDIVAKASRDLRPVSPGAPPRAQFQPPPSPRFEVVTVKENQSVGRAGIVSGPNQPGKYSIINMPLAAIITTAFNVKDFDLVGLPGWTRTTRYDVIGTYPEGANPQAQHLQMIQNVLADRFQLKTHRELIERTVYRLVLARADRRLGPMLVPSSVDCGQWRVENRPQLGAAGKSLVSPSGLRDACTMTAQRNWMSGGAQPVSLLALLLQSQLSARVVDQTGLTGNFDIDLAWVEDQDIGAALPGRPANASAPLSGDLFTAVEEQLGLKLEPSKERVDVLVIDSVGRPTPD